MGISCSKDSNDVYSMFYDKMCTFHLDHHQRLTSMQKQCKKAKTIEDLHRLAGDIHSFCEELHVHHTTEDTHVFPSIARKIDIKHLESQHEQLAQLLGPFEKFAVRLDQLKNPNEDLKPIITEATSLVNKASKLLNEHERAEEKIIEPKNMKKWFSEDEIKPFLNVNAQRSA